MEEQSSYRSLDPRKTIDTLKTLANRIEERFPGAGLCRVCRELLAISEETTGRAQWISKRHLGFRIILIAVVGGALLIGWKVFSQIKLHADNVEELEALTNGLVLVGAALFFLLTLESRLKRLRALKAINELRAISHVIDMHQLTKDPSQVVTGIGTRTKSSPVRSLTPFQLTRYLDYCSEMLSLVGKLAALYAQSTSDSVVLQSVNEIENLTSGISRKIWQKIMILDNDLLADRDAERDAESIDSAVTPQTNSESGHSAAAIAAPTERRPLKEPGVS